jgi:hypothetical protein
LFVCSCLKRLDSLFCTLIMLSSLAIDPFDFCIYFSSTFLLFIFHQHLLSSAFLFFTIWRF